MTSAFLTFFELSGVFVFAITGAIKAIKNRLDFLGVIVFAITVGCAGGIVRDTMLGVEPITAFTNPYYIPICIAGGIVTFILSPKAIGKWTLIPYLDAIGLGIFTSLGCQKAIAMGAGPIAIVGSGILTAVGGGVLRDVFSTEIPMVFTSDFYASASIIGALSYLGLYYLGVPEGIIIWIAAIIATLLRILGYKFKWRLPVAKMAVEKEK